MHKCWLAVFVCCCWMGGHGAAQGGETLGGVFPKVDAVAWGASRDLVRGSWPAAPVLDAPEILIFPDAFGPLPATANYLFNKAGALYNLAWYTAIPVSDMKSAQALEGDVYRVLAAKYGKPIRTFSDGNARDAARVAKDAPKLAEERAKMVREMEAKKQSGVKQSEKDRMRDLGRLVKLVPSIFYSKLAFWDGGSIWVYTNLLCSTDGTCYLHLQFVSKDLTRGENYQATPEKAFSYSPLDRDQDLVEKSNKLSAARAK